MKRAMTNLLVSDVDASAQFYAALLGMTRHFSSDWFVIMTHPGIPGLEFGLLKRDHDIVPETARAAPQGTILTFVMDDVATAHAAAIDMGAAIVEPPTDLFYGQRRMLVRDPDGAIVDVSSPTPNVSPST